MCVVEYVDFVKNASGYLNLIHEHKEEQLLVKNGKEETVILNKKALEELLDDLECLKVVNERLKDEVWLSEEEKEECLNRHL